MAGGGDSGVAKRAERRELDRERRIRDGMSRIEQVFGGFDDNFFGQQRTAQLDYVLPQIRDQYENAQKQLIYTLARGGQLNSSVAAQRNARLAREHQLALTRADSIADQTVKQSRGDVERERGDLIAQLQSTADPESAANQARIRGESLRIGQPLADVGVLFQNATAGLAATMAPRYDEYGARVGGGVSFGGQRDRSRVVGT